MSEIGHNTKPKVFTLPYMTSGQKNALHPVGLLNLGRSVFPIAVRSTMKTKRVESVHPFLGYAHATRTIQCNHRCDIRLFLISHHTRGELLVKLLD